MPQTPRIWRSLLIIMLMTDSPFGGEQGLTIPTRSGTSMVRAWGGPTLSSTICHRQKGFAGPVQVKGIPYFRPRKKISISLLLFQLDDFVEIFGTEKDAMSHPSSTVSRRFGTIVQDCGRGWYAVALEKEDASHSSVGIDEKTTTLQNRTIQKFRSSNLRLLQDDADPKGFDTQKTSSSTIKEPQDIKILDLDSVEDDNPMANHDYLMVKDNKSTQTSRQQIEYFRNNVRHWLVFSDLHASSSSIATCLEVLDHVHSLAQKQTNCGLVFLGDWWHTRRYIRVDVLNAILQKLGTFQVPLILIPGNHDGDGALLPLQNAYRIGNIPGVMVLSQPTKFLNALWIPYIVESRLRKILNSDTGKSVSTIFCHADVRGGQFHNDGLIRSRNGISPSEFPETIPVYSGHFHKPQRIVHGSHITIEYIGSPYQTCLSEAGERKSCLLLDSKNAWNVVQRIPLTIGRRHFKIAINNLEDFLALRISNTTEKCDYDVRPGDRVVFPISKYRLEEIQRLENQRHHLSLKNDVDEHVAKLREHGVVVEIRPMFDRPKTTSRSQNTTLLTGQDAQEDFLSPFALWKAYLDSEIRRDGPLFSNATRHVWKNVGHEILSETLKECDSEWLSSSLSVKPVNLRLSSLVLQGFGPFRQKITYPLDNRGLVLLRGTNRDGGADSNGSGKTSLAMSILWAFTGWVDPRPFDVDSKVADVVNDSSKSARVTVFGTVNDVEFSISRTKSATKGMLSFIYCGNDLTIHQSIKETQEIINKHLGIRSPSILTRTMFYCQHTFNDLLEATDAKLKDEFSLVVPIDVWRAAASLARKRAKEAATRMAELNGMLALLKSDAISSLQKKLLDAESEVERRQLECERSKTMWLKSHHHNRELNECRLEDGNHYDHETSTIVSTLTETNALIALQNATGFIENLEREISSLQGEVDKLAQEHQMSMALRDVELGSLQKHFHHCNAMYESRDNECKYIERSVNDAHLNLTFAKKHVSGLENTWALDLSSGSMPKKISIPHSCPTCHQPIPSNDGEALLTNEIEINVENALMNLKVAQEQVSEWESTLARSKDAVSVAREDMVLSKMALEQGESHWNTVVQGTEMKLNVARQSHQAASARWSAAIVQKMEADMKLREMESQYNIEKDKHEEAVRRADILRTELANVQTRISEIESELCHAQTTNSLLTNLATALGPRAIQAFVLQNAVAHLESLTQWYLNALSDGAQRLELSLQGGDRIMRRAQVAIHGEYKDRSLSSLSGGQWRRCALALNLGFAELISRRLNFRTSFCCMDEPMTHLDSLGRLDVGRLLCKMLQQPPRNSEDDDANVDADLGGGTKSTILLILQDLAAEELEESFDCMDEVRKENGCSSVYVDLESQRALPD